jgi:DNA-binding LytR/AlgR family response regulator
MTLVEAAPSDDMRVILCLQFDRRAASDEVTKFKQRLIDCPSVFHSVESTGAFDFMVEAGLADFVAYHALLDQFGEELATLVERLEASFVCRRFMRVCERDDAIWVPCRDGRRRIACATIDRVCAEGDYVRLHCGEQSWLLHDTMHHMRELLDPTSFITIHRSTIVNIGYIRQLLHRGHYWVLILDNGEEQRIAKSHLAEVLAALRTDSPNGGGRSTTRRRLTESKSLSADQQVRPNGGSTIMRH